MGQPPPSVDGDSINEKEQSIGQKQVDTVSMGIAAAHGPFIQSSRNH